MRTGEWLQFCAYTRLPFAWEGSREDFWAIAAGQACNRVCTNLANQLLPLVARNEWPDPVLIEQVRS